MVFFSANIAIIFTGVYWKIISLTDQELLTMFSVMLAYKFNLTICYLSILQFNIVGRQLANQMLTVLKMQDIMEKIGIPYTILSFGLLNITDNILLKIYAC